MAEITRYLKHRRDTAANWTANNPTLLAGQLGIETDGLTTTPKFKIGDGVTAWNTLPYFYGGAAFVPYTGATSDVDLGAYLLSTKSIRVTGTSGSGDIHLRHQSADATATGQSTSLFADVNGDLKWKNDGNYYTTLKTSTNTANRIYTYPDANGTIALTSNKLSQFATTTSSELAGVISDETGTGALVFGTNPTFTGYISIDNPSPFHKIDISADTQTGSEAIALTQYTAASATSPQVFLRRARGSLATPTAITNNDDLGYYSFRGHNGSAFVGTRASINARASENWSSIANGTRLRFQVTTNGTISAITPMELLDTGNLHLTLSTSSIYLGNITPSSTNYALGYTAANELSVNAISTMRLRVGGTIYGTLTATSLSLSNYLTLGNVGSDIKLYMQRTGGKNTRLETTTTSTRLYNESDTLMMWTAYNNGSFAPGLTSALATNATDGFLYVPSCAGIPTGVPTAITGKIPIVCDSTNNKMYIYSGGAWVALN